MTHSELVRLFKDQVKADGEGVYLPNPEISTQPKYCLVAMEPSLGRKTLEETTDAIEKGFLNFMLSEEDFIVHYSAYMYLCGGKFCYHITDISKGAMKTRFAGEKREERYNKWLPLLQEELNLLGKPKVIAIGKTVANYLSQFGIHFEDSILHYSVQNRGRFLNAHKDKLENNIEGTLSAFVKKIMTHAHCNSEYIEDRFNHTFHRELPEWKRALCAVYRKEFERIANT